MDGEYRFTYDHSAEPQPSASEQPSYQQPQSSYSPESYYQPPVYQPPVKAKKKSHAGRVIALALACALLGGAAGAAAVWFLPKAPSTVENVNISTIYQGDRESTVIQTAQIQSGTLMTPAQVYAANVKCTVGITTSITTNYWGYQTTSAASGSGFIISADGYILTNFHVVEDSNSITVTTFDDTSYEAKLIGYDQSNDIAVLKVDATDLTPVVLGDSENLNVGDQVLAIGNPLGELTFSLTSGYLSALDREVTFSTGTTMNLMQTDCAINSGNSGGALFNLYGEVIGITNAKYSGSSNSAASIDNIGFAIPINTAKAIATQIIEKGYVSKPYIGVTVMDVPAEYQQYGLPKGVAIQSVLEDSPAAKGGLQSSDIITHINGQVINDTDDLTDFIQQAGIGGTLNLTVYRRGQTLELTVTVGESVQAAANQQQQQQSGSMYPWGFGG